MLDVEAREFLEVCGACERIKNTMVSISWRTFTRQCIVASLLLLPWGLVEDFGMWTVLLTILISYFVIAGEAIARYVEDPFRPGRGSPRPGANLRRHRPIGERRY